MNGGALDLLLSIFLLHEGLGRHSAGVCTVAFRATGCSKRSSVLNKKTSFCTPHLRMSSGDEVAQQLFPSADAFA